jgi:hypothetical protein
MLVTILVDFNFFTNLSIFLIWFFFPYCRTRIEAFLPLIIQDTSETVISWIQKALRRNSKLIEMRCSLFIKALVFSCPALYLGQLLSRLFKMMNSFAHLQGFALDLINWPLEGTGLNLLGKYKGDLLENLNAYCCCLKAREHRHL